MRPYVIVPNAKLPLLDGDTLQLAVDVREIDDASITFPPIGMKAKRQQHGLARSRDERPSARCPTSLSRPRRVAYAAIGLAARLVGAVSGGRRVVIARPGVSRAELGLLERAFNARRTAPPAWARRAGGG